MGLRKFRVRVKGCVAKGSAEVWVAAGGQLTAGPMFRSQVTLLWLAPTGSANCPGRNWGCTTVGPQSPRDALHLVLMGRGSR